ncbi:ABC transporter substrate-binding protein [Saccharospirillum salsuginis]|uniref:Peptide ABC transporter substrate-binding protein n=1 Tax=Saccharospirillum salsuginis TaxID=418750 RepID=A0A918K195_9GAMM|nr:ABC transporter substrate-binding protein [Saccharospirillum salsuginis]GGX40973.1 peptide ABC transporter substrate-binding protein [Saccharospirillum salsuginis]
MSNEFQFLTDQARKGQISRRDFLGRALALGIALPFASSVFASAVTSGQPRKGGVLKAGMQGGSSTDSMDPATWTSQVQHSFGQSWGEPLTNVAPNGDLVPRLAEEIGSSSDAKTWTFKLRRGILFHNGKEMTADDVVATLERHSDEDSESGALGIMRGIESVKATGKYEVVVTTTEANADLPYLMSDYHLIIQPNGGKDAPDAGIGTGPYKVTEFQPGVRQRAERFEEYWNLEEFGHADEIEITVINDPTARTAALQSGQIHMANRIEPRVVDMVKRLPNVQVRNVSGQAHYVFLMHCDTAPFSDNDLRLALKYAMDREDMVERILRGYGSVGNDYPINSAYPLHPTDIPQREFDPEKAAYHYKKSGHDGPIVLRTSDVAFPGAVDAAQLYQQSCAQAGINIEVRREPGDGYWSEVWNNQPFCTSYWSGRPTQDQMYSTAYISNADWNDTNFYRDDFDKLARQARGELNDEKRASLYRQMAMMVRDEGGLILPMFNDYIEAHTNEVQGWSDHPMGEMMSGFALSRCWLSA